MRSFQNRHQKIPVHHDDTILSWNRFPREEYLPCGPPWISLLLQGWHLRHRLSILFLRILSSGIGSCHRPRNFLHHSFHRSSVTVLFCGKEKFPRRKRFPWEVVSQFPVRQSVYPAWTFPVFGCLCSCKMSSNILHLRPVRLFRSPGNIPQDFSEYHNGWRIVRPVCQYPYQKRLLPRWHWLLPLGICLDWHYGPRHPSRRGRRQLWFRSRKGLPWVLPLFYGSDSR